MKCPACSNPDTRVIDSREAEDGDSIRRRRVCDRCEERFTTFERSESARIQVLKRDGSRQEFDRRKLASAIGKAASKALSTEEIDRLIDELEAAVRQSGASEIPSGRIGEMVLERLAERDPLSYLRFKIVYSRLEDIDALYDELASLVRIRQVARDRRVAEQITLPIAEPAILHAAIAFLVATVVLLAMASFGGAVFNGWYAGLAPSPAVPSQPGAPVDPNAAKAATAGATAAAVAILLGLAGSVVGGWLGSGERMDFSFYERERARMTRRPVATDRTTRI